MNSALYNKMLLTDEELQWDIVDIGVQRKVMSYNENIMLVKVKFDAGAIGALHHHPHLQMSYIAKGRFEVTMGDEKALLKEGDIYFALPNVVHGVLCIEDGLLVDVFTPAREDFL